MGWVTIVIVGAGLAGTRTAWLLHEKAPNQHIVLIGAETHAPYDRPPLSKSLLSSPAPVSLQEAAGVELDQTTVEVLSGVQVVGIELLAPATPATKADSGDMREVEDSAAAANTTARFRLHTLTGPIEAHDVVIATGTRPQSRWPAAYSLHTRDQADALRGHLLAEARDVTIIGAGWIGCELAWDLVRNGHRVTVIEAGSTPLQRPLGAAIGAVVATWFAEAGIRLLSNTGVHDVVAHTGQERSGPTAAPLTVHTTAGDVNADVVISATGVTPATDWVTLPELARTSSGHLVTDSLGRTTIPGLWAAGDAAAVAGGDPAIPENASASGHWFEALRRPDRVVAALTGTAAPAEPVPEMFSEQFTHRIVGVGNYTPSATPGSSVVFAGPHRVDHITVTIESNSGTSASAAGRSIEPARSSEAAESGHLRDSTQALRLHPESLLDPRTLTDLSPGTVSNFVVTLHHRDESLIGAVVCDVPRSVSRLRRQLRLARTEA